MKEAFENRCSNSSFLVTRLVVVTLASFALVCCSPRRQANVTTKAFEFKIGFGSCIERPDSPIWHSILSKRPDIFLFLGDNIYLERSELGDISKIRARYQALLSQNGFKALREKTKVLAIWDDHDFNLNNTDSTAPNSKASLAAFREIWSNPPGPLELQESVAHKLQVGPIKLIMTDNRSFRVKSGSPQATIFGKKQLDWIQSELSDASTLVTVIASGGQILGTRAKSESLNDYPKERELLLNSITTSPAQVFILSGDRHYAEILEQAYKGKKIIEATSSPLSGSTRDAKSAGTEQYRRALYIGTPNFGVLTLSFDEQQRVRYKLEYFDTNGDSMLSFSDISDQTKSKRGDV